MSERTTEEREIRLSDLAVEVLLEWRMIVLWMLAGGILAGGFGYKWSSSGAVLQQLEMERQRSEMEKELDTKEKLWKASLPSTEPQKKLLETQKINVESLVSTEKWFEEWQAYVDHSVWMQMDPRKVARTVLTFQVGAASEEQKASIEKVYEDGADCGFPQWLVKNGASDTEAAALSEMVSMRRSSGDLLMGGDSFSMTIQHATKNKCAELSEQVISYMDSLKEELQERLGAHTLEVVSRTFAYLEDTDLSARQRDTRADVLSYRKSILQSKANLSELEWRYYNLLTTGKEAPPPDEYQEALDEAAKNVVEPVEPEDITAMRQQLEDLGKSVSSPVSGGVKYLVLGMMLSAFLYTFYVFMRYIFNNRLRASDDVKEMYGIPQLAHISLDREEKKPFDFVDRQIRKLRDRNKRVFVEQEAIGLAAVAVEIQAKKEGLSEVYCIGCDLKAASARIAEQIQGQLKQADISMTVLNNVLYNQESMGRLQSAKGAFLLEKAGETLYEEILKELELLQRQGIKILGGVVISGVKK